MAKIVLEIDDDDLQMLQMAAKVADRTVEEFILEEIIDLADLININGDFKHVTLARHRNAESAEFFNHFNSSGKAQAPITEWAKRQREQDDP